MPVQLSQKERMLLQDQKKHEEICIQKYNQYANQVQDPQLKQLFQTYAKQEQQHKDTVNQILNGQVPQMSQQQNQQATNQSTGYQAGGQGKMQGAMGNADDAALCQDMLMTEKFVSGSYDDTIFQFNDSSARQALNHIQKEEQQHGEGIQQYMQQNNLN
ncbi:MAG: coat protein F [Desulfitibacter sp. BRH_c19]|nr:MAG: coat protein F [Desulfitibacter sp. BRH_c19]